MDGQRWEEEFSHLGAQQKCTASQGSCWLCDCLDDWNVHPKIKKYHICLSEPLPGDICLAIGCRTSTRCLVPDDIAPEEIALAVWLLKKHRCIKALEVGEAIQLSIGRSGSPENVAVSCSVDKSACSLRRISIGSTAPQNWDRLLNDIGPIKKLESIGVSGVMLDPVYVETLVTLLKANVGSLRKVYVDNVLTCQLPGDVTKDVTRSKENMKDRRNSPPVPMNGTKIRKNEVDPLYRSDVLMNVIAGCENLSELDFVAGLGKAGRGSLARLLRSKRPLMTLRIGEGAQDEEVEESLRDFLNNTTTLTELSFFITSGAVSAVKGDNIPERLTAGILTEESIAQLSFLRKNSRLRSLTIYGCSISAKYGELIAKELSPNTTLECLDVSNCTTALKAVHFLCDALTPMNRCSLKFGSLEGSAPEWEALARTLTERNLYGRVHLEATDFEAGVLTRQLHQGLTNLELNAEKLSESNFVSLCEALSSSHVLQSLTVHFSGTDTEVYRSLSNALAKNSSLKSVRLIQTQRGCLIAARAAKGLVYNRSVAHLSFECPSMNTEGAELLRSVIAGSTSLNDIDLSLCEEFLEPDCITILGQGVTQNSLITSFSIGGGSHTGDLHAAIAKNNTRLNHAVRFVLRPKIGSPFVEAFALFQAQPSLVARVKEASGMSEEEAAVAVKAARAVIANN